MHVRPRTLRAVVRVRIGRRKLGKVIFKCAVGKVIFNCAVKGGNDGVDGGQRVVVFIVIDV